jgi:hypothetical protein
MKNGLKWTLIGLVSLVLLGFLAAWWYDQPRPKGKAGPEAERLAQHMMDAVNLSAWQATGAVQWNFAGQHEHLWDRDRSLARVRWGDTEVLLDLSTQRGQAYREGQALPEGESRPLVEEAWSYWVNDAFWLNPVAKLYDQGATRQLVEEQGEKKLLVHYQSGGVTPGDSYLWTLDPDGRPQAWQMWVSVIPIGGVSATWEGWQELTTGAWVSTQHQLGPVALTLSEVQGADTLPDLAGADDPFLPLL